MKTLEDSFSDWEGSAFGFGYGTGEQHIVSALKTFFALCTGKHCNYDYGKLEEVLTPTVAWLLINVLCRHGVDVIEYGTSPRFGWLTPHGTVLKKFIDSKSANELLALTCRGQDYTHCYPDACNCGPRGYQAGVKCDNPFWR